MSSARSGSRQPKTDEEWIHYQRNIVGRPSGASETTGEVSLSTPPPTDVPQKPQPGRDVPDAPFTPYHPSVQRGGWLRDHATELIFVAIVLGALAWLLPRHVDLESRVSRIEGARSAESSQRDGAAGAQAVLERLSARLDKQESGLASLDETIERLTRRFEGHIDQARNDE